METNARRNPMCSDKQIRVPASGRWLHTKKHGGRALYGGVLGTFVRVLGTEGKPSGGKQAKDPFRGPRINVAVAKT